MRRLVLVVSSGLTLALLVAHVCGFAGLTLTDRYPWSIALILVLCSCGLWVYADHHERGGPRMRAWFGFGEAPSIPKWAKVVFVSVCWYAVVNLVLIASTREHATYGWIQARQAPGFYTVDGGLKGGRKKFVREIDEAEHDRIRGLEMARVFTILLAGSVFITLYCATQRPAQQDPSMVIRPKRTGPRRP